MSEGAFSGMEAVDEELVQTKNWLQMVLNGISDGFVVFDKDFRFVYIGQVDAGRLQTFGLDAKRMLGKVLWDILPDLKESKTAQILRQVMEQHTPATCEDKLGNRWYDMHAYPTADGGIVLISPDITDRKHAENKLNYLDVLTANIADAVIGTDATFIINSWNKGAEEIYGWKKEEVIGKTVNDVLKTVYSAEENEAALKNILDLNFNWQGEVKQQHKNGYSLDILASVALIKDSSGRLSGALAINKNITAQHIASQKLQDSEERLRMALESADMGTWDFNLLTHQIVASDKLKELMGMEGKEQFYYEDFIENVYEDDRYYTKKANDDLINMQDGNHTDYELTYRFVRVKDKALRWLKSKGKLYVNKEGKAYRFTGTVVDITTEKMAEENLKYKKALLEAQNEAIADAILVVDHTKGRILSHNKRFVELWRLPNEIAHLDHHNVVISQAMKQVEDYELYLSQLDYYYTHTTEAEKEEVLFKDGRIIERYGKAVIGEDGVKYGWAWFFRDVTLQKNIEREISKKKAQYENMLHGISDAFISFDFKWNVIYANEKACSISGKTLRQLLNKPIWKAIPGILREDSHHIYEDCMKRRVAAQFEYYSQRTKSWADVKVYPTFEGVSIFASDISIRKKAEEELAYQKKLLESVTNNTDLSLFMIDEEKRCVFMNEAAEKMTGYNLKELLGLNLHQFIHHTSVDHSPYPARLSPFGSLTINKRYKDEGVFNHINGSFYPVAYTASPIVVENKIKGAIIEVRDTTEEKKAEQAIKESEVRFRQLADLVPQIIWTARPNGYLDYYNSRWYEFTGFDERFGDNSWTPILHPDDVPYALKSWYSCVNSGEDYSIEYRFKNKEDNTYRWFLGKALPIRDKDGNITKWFGTCTDIHDQKTMSAKLEQLVKERTEELIRSNEDLQQFAHVASHDLREPLRKVRMFSNRLEEELNFELSEKAKNYLEKINSASIRMNSMIEGVLQYATIDNGDQVVEPLKLEIVIDNILTDLEVFISKKQATVVYHSFPVFEGAAVLIHQLFFNLIYNSLKFSKENEPPVIAISGKVVEADEVKQLLHTQPEHRYISIELQDNGIGFDLKQAAVIFNPFTRLHSKDRFEGTGLGLSLCRKIVQRYHGAIYASGIENTGAVFHIVMPLKQQGKV